MKERQTKDKMTINFAEYRTCFNKNSKKVFATVKIELNDRQITFYVSVNILITSKNIHQSLE
jgi:hypothetical protein